MLDTLNKLDETDIASGKLKPIEYDRVEIEKAFDQFTQEKHDDESIKSTSCKSKKKK